MTQLTQDCSVFSTLLRTSSYVLEESRKRKRMREAQKTRKTYERCRENNWKVRKSKGKRTAQRAGFFFELVLVRFEKRLK